MGDRRQNRRAPKTGAAVPISRIAGTPSNTMWPGPRSTSVPSGVFIHPDVWPQETWAKNWVGWACPLSGSSWVPIEHKVLWADAYLHTKWHLDASSRFATIEMGRKFRRGFRPLLGRGAGTASNTKSPGLRPTSMQSAIFIHPAVWLQ